MGPEAYIQRLIFDWFQIRQDFFIRRQNTGAARYQGRNGKEQLVRFGTPGQADLIGLGPDGRFIAIEVKAPKGSATQEQLAYLDEINKRRGIGMIARSLDDVIDRLRAEGYPVTI